MRMKRTGPWILLAGLIASLAGLVWMGCLAHGLYATYALLRMDPLGISDRPPPAPGNYDLLLIGDSLAAHWPIPDAAALNLGIPSQTSAQVLHRSTLLDPGVQAATTLICVGGNDLKILRVNPDLSATVVSTALTNIRAILRQSRHRSAHVFIMTVPPMYTVPFYLKPFRFTQAMLSSLKTLNRGIRTVAAEEGASVLDCERLFHGMDPDVILAPDHVHLSAHAYEILAAEIHADGGLPSLPSARIPCQPDPMNPEPDRP